MLKLPPNSTDDYFIVGQDDSGAPGVALLAGQVLTIVSADPLTVILTPDATPLPTTGAFTLPDGTAVPAGTATQASGKVSAANPPAAPNTPITITVHLANTDGTPVLDDTGVAIPDDTDTVEIVPGLLKKEGILFGTPSAAAGRR